MKKIIAVALLLLVGLAHAQAGKSLYAQERDRILEQSAEGKLSALEAFIEIEAAGRAHFPSDSLLHVFNQSNVGTARQFEQGLISGDKAMELITQRTIRFEETVAARVKVDEAEDRRRSRAAQESAEASQRSQAIGGFLSGMANSLNRQYPRPITCSSTSMPGVVTTNCQ